MPEEKPLSVAAVAAETEPEDELEDDPDDEDGDDDDEDGAELSELDAYFFTESPPETAGISAVQVRRMKPEVIGGVPSKGSLGRMMVDGETTPDDLEDRLRDKFGGGTYEIRPLDESGRRCRNRAGREVAKTILIPGLPIPFQPQNLQQGLGFVASPAAPVASAPVVSPAPPDRLDRLERLLEGALTLLARPQPSGFDSIMQGVKVVKELQGLSGVAAPAAAPSRVNDLHDALELIQRVREFSENKNGDEDENENDGGDGYLVKEVIGFLKDFAKNRSLEVARPPQGGMAFRSIPKQDAWLSGQAPVEEGEQDEMEAILDALLEAIKRGQNCESFAAEVKPKLSRLTRLMLKSINPADAADLIEEKFALEADERALLQSPQGQAFLAELKKYL